MKHNYPSVKCSEEDWLRAKELAKKYTNGNLGVWLRYALANFVPTEGMILPMFNASYTKRFPGVRCSTEDFQRMNAMVKALGTDITSWIRLALIHFVPTDGMALPDVASIRKFSPPTVILTGQVYGLLTVQEKFFCHITSEYKWRCLCECGQISKVKANALTSKGTQSCGCLRTNAGQAVLLKRKASGYDLR